MSEPMERSFPTFDAYEEAWAAFEKKAALDGRLTFHDIPWPCSPLGACGLGLRAGPAERKRKLRAALLRWHPDKWSPVLDRVWEEDRARVTERIKEVTCQILKEKERACV